jgi:hypothetical protein
MHAPPNLISHHRGVAVQAYPPTVVIRECEHRVISTIGASYRRRRSARTSANQKFPETRPTTAAQRMHRDTAHTPTPSHYNTAHASRHTAYRRHANCTATAMARKALAKDQIVKLIVGAGQASPSPPVGPALGSKGVKSMDFCKVRPLI